MVTKRFQYIGKEREVVSMCSEVLQCRVSENRKREMKSVKKKVPIVPPEPLPQSASTETSAFGSFGSVCGGRSAAMANLSVVL